MKHELAINCTASALKHALERLAHARKHETPIHVLKWSFRVEEAHKQFEAANKACLDSFMRAAS